MSMILSLCSKRGIDLKADNETLTKLLAELKKLGKKDFSVKLGSLLDAPDRKYYLENGFRILEANLLARLKRGGVDKDAPLGLAYP